MRLKDKVAIVTGGSQGIGAAISYAFGREGAKVAVANHGNMELGRAVAKKITDAGGVAMSYRCDVSNREECRTLVQEVQKTFGTVDILVNNAGVYRPNEIENIPLEEWNLIMGVNVNGCFFMAQAVVPIMKQKRSGKIIFIASVGGTNAFPTSAAYCASKGAVIMMAKTLAYDIAKHGINVNAISPGNTTTPLNEQLRRNPGFVDWIASQTPSGRAYLDTKDIAGAAVFLASEESNGCHGANIIVDDGWSLL